jgi:type II secretory pathway component PulC
MVQALVIRQAIRIADYVLLALLGFVAYKAIVLIMGLDPMLGSSNRDTTSVEPNFEIVTVGPRTAYDGIVASRMFGPAGELGKLDHVEVLDVVQDETLETELPLRLHGAMATVGLPTDPSASAFITNAAARTIDKDATYWINDEIMEGVRLLEVYPRRVKIVNHRREEWLSMVEHAQPQTATSYRGQLQSANPALARNQRNRNVRDSKMVTLPKEEIYQEMMSMDYAETIRQLRPQMKYDENDNVIGITSDYFSQIPLAGKTGFTDGDVITEVNGTPINSQESVPDLLIKEQNATSVRIRFERDGRPMVRTIRLE